MARLAVLLLGTAGGAFGSFIGFLVFSFLVLSFPVDSGSGALLPAVGGLLFIMLGLSGALGAALASGSFRAATGLLVSSGILGILGLAFFCFFGAERACLPLLILLGISGAAVYLRSQKGGAFLMLLTGILGLIVGQASMVFLLCGWKTWIISGTLLVSSGILALTVPRGFGSHLPLLRSDRRPLRRAGYAIYASLGLLLIVLTTFMLLTVPDKEASAKVDLIEADFAEIVGRLKGAGGMLEAAPDSGCGCDPNKTEDIVCSDDRSCKVLKASITSPGDVQTFPSGSLVTFNCSISGGRKPFAYLWRSSINSAIGDEASFSTDDLSKGLHVITLTVTDSASATSADAIEIGVADPSICGNVNPKPKYYPVDTPCGDIWPNASTECMEFEVCHPGLDYIVEEAVDCCDGTPICGTACAYANSNSGGDKKRCRALYIIKAFGPEARYMSGYALFKACCSGYPECTRTCWTPLGGTPEVREGFNDKVKALPCDPEEWGVRSWRSDANMSENSCSMGLYPTHATVNILRTGVCMDYSAAVTTSIRKAGYSRAEVFSTGSTGYDLPFLGHHPGHAYGMVLLPGDTKYHFVDATGNGEGISIGDVPGYFWFTGCFMGLAVPIKVFDWWVGYCNKTSDEAYNDAGYLASPPRSRIMGC